MSRTSKRQRSREQMQQAANSSAEVASIPEFNADFTSENDVEKEQITMRNNPQTHATIETSQAPEHSGADLVEGLITEGSRGRYRVEGPHGALWCVVRGRLRKELTYPVSTSARRTAQTVKVIQRDPVAIGDRVQARPTGGGEGVIERVVTRADAVSISRDDPDPDGRKLTAVRGIEQIVAVFAAREPEPHLRLADRFSVLAEAQGATFILCVNKADQGIEPWLRERLSVYTRIGYEVVETSAATGEGVERLRALLTGRVSALTGPSGVGKSSLLNALEPGLALRVSAVSDSTGKGRHTTTGARMVPLSGEAGGWLADTAGIRALSLGKMSDLRTYFREFRNVRGSCGFGNCQHLSEPGCAIIAAAQSGAIDLQRYDSYRRLVGAGTYDFGENAWDDPGEEESSYAIEGS